MALVRMRGGEKISMTLACSHGVRRASGFGRVSATMVRGGRSATDGAGANMSEAAPAKKGAKRPADGGADGEPASCRRRASAPSWRCAFCDAMWEVACLWNLS